MQRSTLLTRAAILLVTLCSLFLLAYTQSHHQFTLFGPKALLHKKHKQQQQQAPQQQQQHSALHPSNYRIIQGHHHHHQHQHNSDELLLTEPMGWVEFNNTVQSIGWATLQIKVNEEASNEAQAFAAGYLEGFATAELIGPYWDAFRKYNYNETLAPQFDKV